MLAGVISQTSPCVSADMNRETKRRPPSPLSDIELGPAPRSNAPVTARVEESSFTKRPGPCSATYADEPSGANKTALGAAPYPRFVVVMRAPVEGLMIQRSSEFSQATHRVLPSGFK